MTLSMRIAPHLPYLRRFSRAVTGSQTSGDAYVAATLEALIADLSIFPEASNDRIALYKLFSSAVLVVGGQGAAAAVPPFPGNSARHAICPILRPSRARLSCWSRSKASPTSRPPRSSAFPTQNSASCWTRPSHEISRQVATDILIIEDEPLIAMDIEQMVEGLGHRWSASPAPTRKLWRSITRPSPA